MAKKKPVYMEVTRDKYELPVAVADSPWELAKMRGVSVFPILHACDPRYQRKSKYRLVWIDDNEED